MNKKKTVSVLLCIGLLAFPLFGCGNGEQPKEAPKAGETELAKDEVYATLYMTSEPEEDETAEENPEFEDMTTTVVTVVKKDDLNAETIAEEYNHMVVESLYGKQIRVKDVKQEGHSVKLDLDSKSIQELEIEEGTEGYLFYNMARSIAENVNGVDEVYLTMDGGKDFRLNHLWFEASRPFYTTMGPQEENAAAAEAAPEAALE